MTFEKRVYEQEFKLNDTDDSVIEYIQLHRNELQNVSIHKIAEVLYCSPNAIMRTAKKLGYSGFSELKFSLQKEDNPKDSRTVEHQVLNQMPQNIVKTLDVVEDSKVQRFVKSMIEANKVLFVGIADSVYFCELFGRSLRCLEKHTEYYQHIHDMEYAARHCKKGDLIIVISASGKQERLIELARKARKEDVEVLCITHYGNNPLSEECEEQLCFWGEQRIVNGYNVTDRSGLMMLIRLVCEAYWKEFCV